MSYINKDIKIDFPVPRTIQYLIDDCEKADREDDLGMYECAADSLDNFAKEAYICGALTKEQWDRLCRRYPQ